MLRDQCVLPLLSVVLGQFTNSNYLDFWGAEVHFAFNLSQDPKGQLCMFILKLCLQVLRIAPPLDELGLKELKPLNFLSFKIW